MPDHERNPPGRPIEHADARHLAQRFDAIAEIFLDGARRAMGLSIRAD